MKKLTQKLTEYAKVSIIVPCWFFLALSAYLFWKPIYDYTYANGLDMVPDVLDSVTFYTANQGYQILIDLKSGGRDAYRLANYIDFILPIFLFLSLSLTNLVLNKTNPSVKYPFIYLVSDYLENLTEKYVLEIFPERNDFVMNLTCYLGVIKMLFFTGSSILLLLNFYRWMTDKLWNSKRK